MVAINMKKKTSRQATANRPPETPGPSFFLDPLKDSQILFASLLLIRLILKILFFPHLKLPSQVCRFALYNPTAT